MPNKRIGQPRGMKLGQHFLFDKGILSKIADTAGLCCDDCVLEVGPGLGTLTEVLASRAGKVAAVELDGALIPRLRERLSPHTNTVIVHADIMKADMEAIWRDTFEGKPFKVVANLPYYITTPVIMRLLESGLPIVSLTVMVQKEVADRLVSEPGSKDYGAISVAVQFRTEAERSFLVPAGAFSPPPRVQSAVLKMVVRREPPAAVPDMAMFEKTVRGCFAARRKTLRNNVAASFGISGDEAARLLSLAGLDPQGRAEQLDLAAFAALASCLYHEGLRANPKTGE